MMALYGTSGFFFFLFLHLFIWLPTPTNSLHATSLIGPARNGNKDKATGQENNDSLKGLERISHRIRRGDTLGELLKPLGLSGEEKLFWVRSIRKQFSPRRLRPGREIYFYFSENGHSQPGENGKKHLKALAMELDEDWVLTWELGDQEISFRKYERPYEIEIKASAGIITDSLYESGARLGIHPKVISQFVDIFGWDVNFNTDLRAGDSFRILFERRYRSDRKKKETFRVLAGELTTGKEKHFAFYFEKEEGDGGYYDLEGKSLARTFLRYPVEFSRISSSFSHRRFHPILRVRKAHQGVDFVARRGTPVRAVGDGRVTYVGWKRGGYGRFIEIQHGSIYKSRYAHLNGYTRGLRRGRQVKKGQIIGYVGCSGRCTGSHLHFELHKNHRYVNPLKIQLPREDKIEPPLREVFETAKEVVLTQLVSGPRPRDLDRPKPGHWQ